MIQFRLATPVDIPLLQEMARTIWHRAYRSIITVDQIETMLAGMYGTEVIRAELKQGVVWKILEEAGLPAGYLACSMASPEACKIHKVYVMPERQGRGLGTRMLEEAERYARGHGARSLFLLVNRHNGPALKTYRAYGFTVAESLDWEFAPGLILEDYRMTRELA